MDQADNTLTFPAPARNVAASFTLACDLLKLIDTGQDEGTIAQFEVDLLKADCRSDTTAIVQIAVAASWFEAARHGTVTDQELDIALAAVRRAAVRLGAGGLSKRVREYYGLEGIGI